MRKNSENSDNLMKINKNMAKLVSKISAKISAPKFSVINLCRTYKGRESNSELEFPATQIILLALPQLPTTKFQLIKANRSYARIKYRVYTYG